MKSIKYLILLFLLLGFCEKNKKEKAKAETGALKTGFEILPQNPTIKDKLIIRRISANYPIKWYVNGKFVSEGKELELKGFRKGDTVYAEVSLNDRKITSNRVVIRNSPPIIKNVSFNKKNIFSNDKEIKLNIEYEDPNNDPVGFLIKWYKNGELISENTTTIQVNLRAGDVIEAFVYAYDNEDTTDTPYIIKTVVLNSPPVISEKKGGEIKIENGVIHHKINAFDPDGDPLRFKLLKAPPGITLDSLTGILSGKLSQEIKKVKIQFMVRDTSGNRVTYEFNLFWKE